MTRTRTCPRKLPVILHEGQRYFVDARLREFRSVAYPPETIEFVGFDTERGREILAALAVRECSECKTVIVEAPENECVQCPECGGELKPVTQGWL